MPDRPVIDPARFDAVLFSSVLHEFFAYGEGVSSVLKALADAHELLRPSGVIVIRDMILEEYTKATDYGCKGLAEAVARSPYAGAASDFVGLFFIQDV